MRQKLRSYIIIALGSLIFALAFDWFIAANQVAMGGITGLAQVVHILLPQCSVGMLAFAMNVPLFLLGWKYIGFHLLATSLFSMVVSSLAIDAIAAIHTFAPMDPMLACLCGGALLGVGLGMVFSQGATTGGTDIVARLLKLKFPWLPMGKVMMIPDGVALCLVAIAFGKVEAGLYGAVVIVVSTRVMDMVLYGLDTSKVAYIISGQWQEIVRDLLAMGRGVTVLRGRGAYTGEDKQLLLVAFKQKEIVQIKRAVHQRDPGAFMIVCDAHDVLGEGFGEYQQEEL